MPADPRVDLTPTGPLGASTDAIKQLNVFEHILYPTSRAREFRDAITRANGALPGVPTQALQWGRWTP